MVNKVILVGRMTADPDVRATEKGSHVARLRVVTNTYLGRDESGEKRELSEFHRVVAFGQRAEFAGNYLRKGRLVCVTGRLQTNEWQDSEGNRRWTTEVVVDELEGLDRAPQEAAA